MKFKEFVKKYALEIVACFVFFAFIGFSFIPLIKAEYDGVTYNLSIMRLMLGVKLTDVSLRPDVMFITIFILFAISPILVGIRRVFVEKGKENVASKLLVATNWLLIVANILMLISFRYLPVYDEVYGAIETELLVLPAILYVEASLILLIFTLRVYFSDNKFSIFDLVEMAMLVALAIGLDKLVLWKAPTGGSINLSCVALCIYAYRRGVFKGFIASSVIFGILSCTLDGYGFQTYPFDYFIAFSGFALCGIKVKLFKEKLNFLNIAISFSIGCIAGFVTRMIGSTTSSMVYFLSYLSDQTLRGALIYNVAYIGPSAGIVLAVLIALSKPIELIDRIYPAK